MIDTQERINLGQAKNQATMIMTEMFFKGFKEDREKMYKELVKSFYKWNKELDEEMGKGDVFSDNSKAIHGLTPKTESIPPISPKQKYCPKCNIKIPKTWTKHLHCGWEE